MLSSVGALDRRIRTLGDPGLRIAASPVKAFGTELKALVSELTRFMHELGGIGIAAPQIGVLKRVMLMECSGNPRYPDVPDFPLVVCVNPILRVLDAAEEEAYEGCLSLPRLRGPVRRAVAVELEAQDLAGESVRLVLTGAFARVALHEIDHLDGVLFIDRITPQGMGRLGFHEELVAAGIDLQITGGTAPTWRRLDP